MASLDVAILAAAAGITGTLLGVFMNQNLEIRRSREKERRDWELQQLEAAAVRLKRLGSRTADSLVLPIPFLGYRTIDALRDLMYLSPGGLDQAALDELLAVLREGVIARPRSATLRRWLLGDARHDKALLERLTGAESALARSIAARRAELISPTETIASRNGTSLWRRMRRRRRAPEPRGVATDRT